MINLQPLIEKFKKAVYGRDVRQSIVDLAQAIGDNHNEQETLRYEVKTLNADTKEENKQGKEYITTKKAELDDAITAGKTSIESTVSTALSVCISCAELYGEYCRRAEKSAECCRSMCTPSGFVCLRPEF